MLNMVLESFCYPSLLWRMIIDHSMLQDLNKSTYPNRTNFRIMDSYPTVIRRNYPNNYSTGMHYNASWCIDFHSHKSYSDQKGRKKLENVYTHHLVKVKKKGIRRGMIGSLRIIYSGSRLKRGHRLSRFLLGMEQWSFCRHWFLSVWNKKQILLKYKNETLKDRSAANEWDLKLFCSGVKDGY